MDAAAESFDCAEGWEEGWSDCDIINFWNQNQNNSGNPAGGKEDEKGIYDENGKNQQAAKEAPGNAQAAEPARREYLQRAIYQQKNRRIDGGL